MVFEKVIPELCVLQSMTVIRDIDDKKKVDEIKKKEKAAFEALMKIKNGANWKITAYYHLPNYISLLQLHTILFDFLL